MSCRGEFKVCVVFGVFVVVVFLGGARQVKVERRNSKWICCKACLMVSSACLYVVQNSSRVNVLRDLFYFFLLDLR